VRQRRWVGRTLRVGLVLVMGSVLVLPWLREATGFRVLDLIDGVLAVQCHRLDGRVLDLWGMPMAVCSRCAGINLGVMVGALLAWPRWTVRVTFLIVGVALVAMVMEAGLEAVGVLPAVHAIRIATGVMLAWPVSAIAVRRWGGLEP